MYDGDGALRVLAKVADEADPNLNKAARTKAGEALLTELAAIGSKLGVHVRAQTVTAVMITVGHRNVFVQHTKPGEFVSYPDDEPTLRKDVPLTYDVVDQKFLGPSFDAVDPATGTQVKRYRDALVTVVQTAAQFLRRS